MKSKEETIRPELTFDGCGINGPDEYRTRVATFNGSIGADGIKKYGPLFAAAPELLEALRALTNEIALSKLNIRKDFSLINAHACALKAIARAEGKD